MSKALKAKNSKTPTQEIFRESLNAQYEAKRSAAHSDGLLKAKGSKTPAQEIFRESLNTQYEAKRSIAYSGGSRKISNQNKEKYYGCYRDYKAAWKGYSG